MAPFMLASNILQFTMHRAAIATAWDTVNLPHEDKDLSLQWSFDQLRLHGKATQKQRGMSAKEEKDQKNTWRVFIGQRREFPEASSRAQPVVKYDRP